ncbi:MAG: 2-C-methyl-D-erythritol 4-phosphate cytidylyltransferase [bacterium]
MHVSAIIVAAGSGRRLGGNVPKQFQPLSGKPVLFYTLNKFEQCRLVDDVLVVLPKEWMRYVSENIVKRFDFKKIRKLVTGGAERQDSVWAGIQALSENTDLVGIHDAVRPFVSQSKIKETIAAAQETGAAILAVTPKDTVKLGTSPFIEKTLPRNRIWCVQTPQVFDVKLIKKAYLDAQAAAFSATDDSALVERVGGKVKIVPGENTNIKITEAFDFELAARILEAEQKQCV